MILSPGLFKTINMSKLEQVKIPISVTKYTLYRHNDGMIQHGANIGWVEWREDGRFKELHKEPAVGLSLILDPHSWAYTWLTTPVTEIVEQGETHIVFKTNNSNYELTWIDK